MADPQAAIGPERSARAVAGRRHVTQRRQLAPSTGRRVVGPDVVVEGAAVGLAAPDDEAHVWHPRCRVPEARVRIRPVRRSDRPLVAAQIENSTARSRYSPPSRPPKRYAFVPSPSTVQVWSSRALGPAPTSSGLQSSESAGVGTTTLGEGSTAVAVEVGVGSLAGNVEVGVGPSVGLAGAVGEGGAIESVGAIDGPPPPQALIRSARSGTATFQRATRTRTPPSCFRRLPIPRPLPLAPRPRRLPRPRPPRPQSALPRRVAAGRVRPARSHPSAASRRLES